MPILNLLPVRTLLRPPPTDGVIAIVLALLLGVIWTVSLRIETQIERKSIDTSFSETRNLAHLLMLHWSETLQRVDALQRLARLLTQAHLNADRNEPELRAELHRSIELAGSRIVQVSAIDPAGDMIWSNLPMPPEGVNLADRQYYKEIVNDARDRITAGPVLGVVTGRWTITFAEALRNPDRTLRAMTVVSIDAGPAVTLAKELNIEDHGIVSVIRNDGVVLARSPNVHVGEVVPSLTSLWRAAWQNGSAEGLVPDPWDIAPHFSAGRRIEGSDLVVMIGLDAAHRMAPVTMATQQLRRSTEVLSFAVAAFAVAMSVGFRRQRILARERQRIRDLTQREALLRHIAEQATDIISLQDGELRNIYVSPAVRGVLGVLPQEVIGCRFAPLALPSDQPIVEAAVAALARSGAPQRVSFRASHADGGFRWLETQMVSVAGPGDDMGCQYMSITRDITDRKLAEEALRQTQKQLEMLLQMGPGTMYRLAIDGRGERQLSIPCAGVLQSMGYTDQDEVGSFFMLRVHPPDLPGLLAATQCCVNMGHAVAEYRFPTAGGETRWLRDEMRLAGREGDVTILIGYVTDITAEHEVNTRLRQTERLAMLGEVATRIAHELNQPLAAIALAAENGGEALISDPARVQIAASKFRRIKEQAERLGAVIRNIQMFGRKQTEHAVVFPLAEVVRNSLLLAAPRLKTTGASVTVDLPADLPELRGAPVLLEQVLLNLIVNACDAYADATPRDGAAVERRIHLAARRDGGGVVISVADRAGGVPPEVIDRIFDPFFTTKPPGKGTGLGLSICFATVADMGGQISARNEAGGAVFEVRLPLAAGTGAGASGPLPSAPASVS